MGETLGRRLWKAKAPSQTQTESLRFVDVNVAAGDMKKSRKI